MRPHCGCTGSSIPGVWKVTCPYPRGTMGWGAGGGARQKQHCLSAPEKIGELRVPVFPAWLQPVFQLPSGARGLQDLTGLQGQHKPEVKATNLIEQSPRLRGPGWREVDARGEADFQEETGTWGGGTVQLDCD